MKTAFWRNSFFGLAAMLMFCPGGAFAQEVPISQKTTALAPIADTPERWDAALFLPPSAFNTVLTGVAGSSVVIPVARAPDVRISLLKAMTKFDYGAARVEIEIAATPSIGGPSVALAAIGALRFAGFDRGKDDAAPRAKFTVTIDSLKPTAKAGKLTLDGSDLAAKLVKSEVLKFLSEYLSFAVPVPLDLVGEAGFDGDAPFATRAGKVLLHIKAPGARVSKKLSGMATVFVPAGVWLCAEYDGVKRPAVPAADELPPSERWKLYQENAIHGAPSLLVRGEFIEEAINELGDLPAADRTVTVRGKAHKGNLVEGATTVWLHNNEEKGSLTITPSAQWTKDGLKVACAYKASAHAAIGFNFKFPGGSVGSKVGCDGDSAGRVQGTLRSSLVSRSEPVLSKTKARAAVLIPQFAKGQELKASVETDGTFKTKLPFGGWFKTGSPRVKVEAALPVPTNILPNLTLLTNEPRPIDMANRLQLPPGWALTPPKAGFPTHAVLEPRQAVWGKKSYLLAFSFTLETLAPDEASARKKVLDHLAAENARPGLKLGKISVSVAGIGPNNDLIKALVALAKGVANAYEEAKKAGENVDATIAKANRDITRQLDRSFGDVEREAGKGAHNTVKTFGKAVNDTGKAIGTFADRAIGGPAKKAGKAVRKAVDRATGGLIKL